MDEITLRKLILSGESTSLDFKSKRKIADPHGLAAECVGFLNKRGGRILLGVEDNGEIDGFASSEIEAVNSTLRSLGKDKIIPPVFLDTENVLIDDHVVIILTLEEGIDKPYQTAQGGKFYIRTVDGNQHVSHRDELRRLFQIGSHVFAEKKTLLDTTLDQIDIAAYRNYYENRFQEEALEDEEDLIAQMRSLHLIHGQQMTLAGCLLFGKSPERELPEFGAKIAWFKGLESASVGYRDQRSINGSLRSCYEEVMSFLNSWNLRAQAEGASYNDNGEPLVHPHVFEELVTNAFIHRDYFIRDTIKLFIFDDRLELTSPGSLPNSLTLTEAQNGIRRSRNPIIEEIGQSLMQYKGHGTGLKRAMKLCPRLELENNVSQNVFIARIYLSR